MTKIDIFSGFLGAGKTTLIKKLIQEAYQGEKLVLIENEFGEIGIDGGFLQDAGVEITEMNSGCICCSLVGDFGQALEQVLFQFKPDRIIIEPSGVGKLSDVIGAVQRVDSHDIQLNAFVTVADATKCKIYMKNFGEFYNNQIEHAAAIVLSRTDGMSEKKLLDTVKLIREHNANAPIITTPWDQLDGKTILETMENKDTLKEELARLAAQQAAHDEEEHEHHHHHHDHDDEDEHEHHHHHHDHDDEDEHEHHHHHHDHDDEDEHEHHHHHHDHDDEDEHEHEHHHHHDHDDEDEHEHHHHHDHDDEDEHEHHHHHHHDHDHGPDCTCGCHDHDHDADEVFLSWGAETPRKYGEEEITAALEALGQEEQYGIVLRAKGIVPCTDGTWIHFDYVPGEKNVRRGPAGVTGRLCVIGSELKEEALDVLFHLD
jgi:G3E family GTPase